MFNIKLLQVVNFYARVGNNSPYFNFYFKEMQFYIK